VIEGDHYCSMPQCKERKVKAWDRKHMADMAEKIGIALYQKSDGEHVDLYWRDANDQKLFKGKHADLRLLPAQHMWNNFDDVPSNLKVVAVGKTAEKKEAGIEKSQAAGDTSLMKADAQKKVRAMKNEYVARFQWDVAAVVSASALDGVTSVPLLKFILDDLIDFNRDADMPDGVDKDEVEKAALTLKKADGLKQLRRLLMLEALYAGVRNDHHGTFVDARKPVVEYANALAKMAEEWCIKLPKNWSAQAQKYQDQLDAALKALADESKKSRGDSK